MRAARSRVNLIHRFGARAATRDIETVFLKHSHQLIAIDVIVVDDQDFGCAMLMTFFRRRTGSGKGVWRILNVQDQTGASIHMAVARKGEFHTKIR